MLDFDVLLLVFFFFCHAQCVLPFASRVVGYPHAGPRLHGIAEGDRGGRQGEWRRPR